MLTGIGKFLRKLRIDNNEILLNMAVKLNVTVSFLSAVENGKKRIPSGWYERICTLYALTDSQAEAFAQAIAETEKSDEMNFQDIPASNRMLGVSFARRFSELSEEQIAAIREILNKGDSQ